METIDPYYRRSAIASRHEFFGRRGEIHEIFELLRQQQSIFLIGERRTGKSSILNAISFLRTDDELPPEIQVVFVNCLYAEKSPERRFIKHMLTRIDPDFDGDDLPAEQESLDKVAAKAASQGKRLVILMDEFDVLLDNPLISGDLYSFFRAWSDEYRIPFVITTREGRIEPLLNTVSVGSPFWNIFKTIYVGPFSHSEAIELITIPAELCRMPFTNEEVEWVHQRGGHHPFFLQIAASHAFTKRDLEPDRRHAAFMGEANPHFDYLIDFMPEVQLAALMDFQIGRAIDDSRVKSDLLMKGMLIEENGKLQLFSSALDDKLRTRRELINSGPTTIVGNVQRFFRGEL